MSFRAITWALDQRVEPAAPKFLLVALASFASETGYCYPGQSTLAEMTGMSEKSVSRNLVTLEQAGLIERVRRYNRRTGLRTSDGYWLIAWPGYDPNNRDDGDVGARPRPKSANRLPDKTSGDLPANRAGSSEGLPDKTSASLTVNMAAAPEGLPDILAPHELVSASTRSGENLSGEIPSAHALGAVAADHPVVIDVPSEKRRHLTALPTVAPVVTARPAQPDPDSPFGIFAAFVEAIGADPASVAPRWKSRQLGVAKRLLEDGYGADTVARCIRYMQSQSWRTGPIDLLNVEKVIGTWEVYGMPEAEAVARPPAAVARDAIRDKSLDSILRAAQRLPKASNE